MFPDSPFLPTFPRKKFAHASDGPRSERVPEVPPPYHPVFRPRPKEAPERVRPPIVPMRPGPKKPAKEPDFEPSDSLV